MIITCPNCNKKFKIDNSLIPDEGRNLQCGSCTHVWLYKIEEENSKILKLKESIEVWIKFIENLPETSNQEASVIMEKWVRTNYEFLGIDKETIDNYTNNVHFEMQVTGIRNYLLKKKNP